MTPSPPSRLLALVLATILVVTFVAPAKADADVLAAVGIATLVIAGVIIVAYLIVANVTGSQQAGETRTAWIACAGDGCAAILARSTDPPPSVLVEAP